MRIVLVIALCSACYSPAYKDCEVTCATQTTCPSGYSCESGFCVASPGTSCANIGTDGGMDAPDAAMLPPWGMPTPVQFATGTPTGIDDDPTVTDDGLLLFVHRTSGANIDVFGSARNNVMAAWPSPALTDVSTSSGDGSPEISPDGLTMYFSSDRNGPAMGYDIFRATRPDRAQPWVQTMIVIQSVLNSTANDESPAISRDGLTLVFNSRRSGTGDLFFASRMTLSQNFNAPVPMTPLNDATHAEESPFLSTDKLTIYFSSNRNGNHDLFQATRPDAMDMFGAPSPITELNTAGDESDPWVSLDGKVMYFTRVVGGQLIIMQATR